MPSSMKDLVCNTQAPGKPLLNIRKMLLHVIHKCADNINILHFFEAKINLNVS